jgi:PEGA domain
MTDGLGRRVGATDPATGEPEEHLELATELVLHTAFAAALAERVTRLAAVRHASYVQVRRIDRPAIDRLVVVSSATPGRRLSDLLDASAAADQRPDIEAVVALLRQLLPAAALFSRNRQQALGTLGPERLFIVPPARVVIADGGFGSAIDLLQLTRAEAWQRYQLAMPPAEGFAVSTPRGDATGVGVVALSMLLGRRLGPDEFPTALPALVSSARERHGDEDHALASVFSRWLRRALQVEDDGFESPHAAQIAFEEVLASNRRYVTGTDALEAWVEGHAQAVPLPPFVQAAAAAASEAALASAVEPRGLGDAGAQEGEPSGVHEAADSGRASSDSSRVLGLRSRWAAVAVAVLFLQAGVIAWYWSRPGPGPAAGEGELVVTSRPDAAQVIVDGSARGVTPLTVTLSAGAHVVEVRAGTGEPRVIPLMIRANVQTAQYVELQEAVPVAPPVETRTVRKAPVKR